LAYYTFDQGAGSSIPDSWNNLGKAYLGIYLFQKSCPQKISKGLSTDTVSDTSLTTSPVWSSSVKFYLPKYLTEHLPE